MTKFIILILLVSSFNLSFGQVDTVTVGGIRVIVGKEVTGACETIKKNNKIYHIQIGETFHRTVLASGWFKQVNDSCYQSVWIGYMIKNKFYQNENDVFIKYKKGKPYSGRINENDGDYKLIGSCRKGLLHGKVKIKDNQKIIWEGKMSHGLLTNP
jgi:hypothetical protein